MARNKNTWPGRVVATGVSLDGSVLLDIVAEHGTGTHPVRVELSRRDAQLLAGELVLDAIRTDGLEKTHTISEEIAS